MRLLGKNLYIANKKANQVQEIEINETMLYAKNEKQEILQTGCIDLRKDVYACLYYGQLNTIVFIIQKEIAYMASFVLADAEQFRDILKKIKEVSPDLELSEQNAKINGYAMSVVTKLNEGVTVKILETKEGEKVKCCPECGMQCDPNIPYCMECGASV